MISGTHQNILAVGMCEEGFGVYENRDWLTYKQFRKLYFNKESRKVYKDILQMYILFDDVILSDIPSEFDLTRMKNCDSISYDTYRSKNDKLGYGIGNPVDISHLDANFIKNAVINHLCGPGRLNWHFYDIQDKKFLIQNDINPLVKYPLTKNDIANMQALNKSIYTLVFDKLFDKNFSNNAIINSLKIHNDDEHKLLKDIEREINYDVMSIIWMLEQSVVNDAQLYENIYNLGCLKSIRYNLVDEMNNKYMEAYKVIKMQFNKGVLKLPYVDTLEMAMEVKRSKKHEIKSFRNEMDKIVSMLNNENDIKKIKKVVKDDIKKANYELTKNIPSKEVKRWITALPLPVSCAEVLIGIPPVAGLSVAILGKVLDLYIKNKTKKHSWISLYRQ